MAKGDYILFNQVPFQSVSSHPRRYGVMFNPSSSRSRLRIIDAGRRYGVRLRADGTVEYSIDGDRSWQSIAVLKEPCTGVELPEFISYDDQRIGQALTGVRFDMIAVGRGRAIAKEAGTDRLFHIVMDELFRTFKLEGEGCTEDKLEQLNEDPPVPGFYMKLDPEYFLAGPASLVVPPGALRSYGDHPASLRLPVFAQLLDLEMADVMLVLQRARTWYLVDTRSQLSIMGPEDFGFTESDLKAVFTEPVIRDILRSLQKAAGPVFNNWFADLLVDDIARDWRERIEKEGLGVLVFPLYVALGVLLYIGNISKGYEPDPSGKIKINLRAWIDALAGDPDNKPQPLMDDAIAKLFEAIAELRLLSRRNALQKYGERPDVQRVELPPEWTIEDRMPTPNQPPAWLPTYVRTTYVSTKGTWRGIWKKLYGDNDQFQRVWFGTNADGRLEVFGVGTDETVWHTWEEKPNGKWIGAWSRLHTANDKLRKLAIARNHDGRLEVFGVAPDDRVWHTWQVIPNNGWNDTWVELYSSADRLRTIATGQNQDGRLEVFGVAPNNTIWHTWQTDTSGSWNGGWEQLYSSEDKLRDIWVERNADGRLEAFGISPDDRIWHTWQTTPGGDWNGGWGEIYSPADRLRTIAVARNSDGRLELFGISPDGRTWHTWQTVAGTQWNGAWIQFYSSSDRLRDLWAVTNVDGRLEVFGISSDDRVWHTWQSTPSGDWNGAWIELEASGGRRTLAAATNADGQIEIVGLTSGFLTDNRAMNIRLAVEERYAIQFSKVLDLGVGYSHWSEQWLKHFGGEIHSILATRPAFQQERYNLIQYRFLNGPVIDGDGYNDGTTNFYMFVKLGPAGADGAGMRQRYAIVWLDEQTYFTQRWRLLHPTDDILGDLFSLHHSLRNNPEWFNFSLGKYWSPFEGDLLDDNSRMAVRRQIVALTGFNQTAQRHEIFTIAYNFGVCDHTWRWRLFPTGEQVLIDSSIAQDMQPQLPAITTNGPANSYVVVNTLDLRDDTMMHVRGSMRSGDTPLRQGRWVQRYLPADCRHVPARHQLTGGKPASGFDHRWDFVSEAAYRRADQFYQFGVYEQRLDSRCQYYEVELLPGTNGVLPRVEDVIGRVWSNDATGAGEERMRINTTNFVWSLPKEDGAIVKRLTPEPDKPLAPELLTHEHRLRSTMSIYEETTRFRLLERKPLGLIAVFYDKRDDELQSATDLPHPTTFRKDSAEANIPTAWKTEDGEDTSTTPDTSPAELRVLVKTNRRVLFPPNVRKAQIIRDKAPGIRALHVSFWTPQTEQEVCENIWKVSLAALVDTGVVPIFSVTRFPNFVRRAIPDGPLSFDFTGELGDAWRYDFTWKFEKDVENNVVRFCSPEGHIEFATSLWFEDVVGHRSLAQELVFA